MTNRKTARYFTVPKLETARRSSSIVVHGIDENKEVDDRVYTEKLFSIMEMDHTSPTLAHRLGSMKVDSPRPLKVTMKTKNIKAEFMSKLWKLRYADTAYKKIRVTDDYTYEEREEIRRWVHMANQRTKRKQRKRRNENELHMEGTKVRRYEELLRAKEGSTKMTNEELQMKNVRQTMKKHFIQA